MEDQTGLDNPSTRKAVYAFVAALLALLVALKLIDPAISDLVLDALDAGIPLIGVLSLWMARNRVQQ